MNKEPKIEEIQKNLELSLSDLETLLKSYANRDVYKEFMSRLAIVVIAGLGLISALAWDEVLKESFFALVEHNTVGTRLLYALVLTFITAFVSVVLGKIIARIAKK